MTEARLAEVAIRTAATGWDMDTLATAAGLDPDALAYFLTGLLTLEQPALARLTAVLWGADAAIVHGRVRPVTTP